MHEKKAAAGSITYWFAGERTSETDIKSIGHHKAKATYGKQHGRNSAGRFSHITEWILQ